MVADAGWAWGAQFADFNNDGTNELFVANGFISASRERDYWYSMSKIAGAHRSLFEDARTWPPFGDASLSGPQDRSGNRIRTRNLNEQSAIGPQRAGKGPRGYRERLKT